MESHPAALTSNYYDRCVDEYAQFADSHDSESLIGSFLDGLLPGATVLDVGCGSGRDLEHLKYRGFRGFGVDRSWQLASRAQCTRAGSVSQADMTNLPIGSGSVDAVIAIASIHHLPPAMQRVAVSEIARVLVEGGSLLLTAKASSAETWDRHPEFGCVRGFFPLSPSQVSRFARAAGLGGVSITYNSDRHGSDRRWTRMVFRKEGAAGYIGRAAPSTRVARADQRRAPLERVRLV